MFSSCSQDEDILSTNNDYISFIASVPDVSSRSTYDLKTRLLKDGFTVSAISPDSVVAPGSILPPFFQDVTVRCQVDNIFRSNDCKWTGNPDKKEGHLRFFAFHPSRTEMMKCAGVGSQNFIYSNNTRKDDSGVSYDYRLTKFRVAPDISKQVDFITAIGEGNKTDHLYCGIELTF